MDREGAVEVGWSRTVLLGTVALFGCRVVGRCQRGGTGRSEMVVGGWCQTMLLGSVAPFDQRRDVNWSAARY